jgi:exonuclease VII large subunit
MARAPAADRSAVVILKRLRLLPLLALAVGIAAPSAAASTPTATAAAELRPIEQATAELGQAKRAATATVRRLGARSKTALSACARGGPGWKRIRAVRNASQRSLYTASARRLLADMRLLIEEQQSRIAAYDSAFAHFVSKIEAAPVSDPLLRDAIAAQSRRLAAYDDIVAIKADCAVFNKLAKRAREFPTRTAEQIVRADYKASPIARRIERHIANQLRTIDRRNGISWHDVETLDRAADRMVSLGGNPGYATGFQYALSLR